MKKATLLLLLLIPIITFSQSTVTDNNDIGDIGQGSSENGWVLSDIKSEFKVDLKIDYKGSSQNGTLEKIYSLQGGGNITFNIDGYQYNNKLYSRNDINKIVGYTVIGAIGGVKYKVAFSNFFDPIEKTSLDGRKTPGFILESKTFSEQPNYESLKFSYTKIIQRRSVEFENQIKQYLTKKDLENKAVKNNDEISENDNLNTSSVNNDNEINTKTTSNSNQNSSNANSENQYDKKQREAKEIVNKRLKDGMDFIDKQNRIINQTNASIEKVGQELLNQFDAARKNMAKQGAFNNTMRSLTSIQSNDATGIINESRQKSKEINSLFNQKSTEVYNEINNASRNLINSSETTEQVVFSSGISILTQLLSQKSLKKAREEAQRQLEEQKEKELKKLSDKIINKYSGNRDSYFERIPFAVLETEEAYYIEQYNYSKCMCDNARKIIIDNYECSKPKLKYQKSKDEYSALEYFNAFKRKSKSEKTRIKEQSEYFLELAIDHKNSKPIWLIDKANYGNKNVYQKLILSAKAYDLEVTNEIIKNSYQNNKKEYQKVVKKAKMHTNLFRKKFYPNWNWNEHNNIYVVKLDDIYFFCNKDGSIISPYEKYEVISQFDNGVAIFFKKILTEINTQNSGLIDNYGKVITKKAFTYIEPFSDGLSLAYKHNEGYQFLNNKGENVFNKTYNSASSFKDGVAKVSKTYTNKNTTTNSFSIGAQKNSKKYFINTKGIRVLKGDYDVIGDFSEGLALARNKKGKLVFLNTQGKTEFEISSKLQVMHVKKLSDFKNGYSLMRNGRTKFNYIDKKGKVAIKTSYINPQSFKENRALVSNFEDGKITYSFIDTKGKLICNFKYDKAFSFSEGRAPVAIDGKYGFIDLNGKLVIPLKYDSLGVFKNGIAQMVENGKVYKIDLDGKIIKE